MKFGIDKTGTIKGLEEAITSVLQPDTKILFILSCDGNRFVPSHINAVLTSLPVPVYGAIFPAIIVGPHVLYKGNFVISFPKAYEVLYLPDLDADTHTLETLIDDHFSSSLQVRTAIVMADASSGGIQNFIDSLFTVFGLEINYIGGGAGSITTPHCHCIITNDGLSRNSAIIAATELSSGIGVGHGWEPLVGPFQVTASKNNILYSLNWKPAFEVYQHALKHYSKKHIDTQNFSETAHDFPFGIVKLGGEIIVRDPVQLEEDGAIVFAGDIPTGAFVDILNGDEERLIEAARQSAEDSHKRTPYPFKEQSTILIDCISRALYLKESFEKEMLQIYHPDQFLFGALTIGEIGNNGRNYLEFFNKTIVVAQIERL